MKIEGADIPNGILNKKHNNLKRANIHHIIEIARAIDCPNDDNCTAYLTCGNYSH